MSSNDFARLFVAEVLALAFLSDDVSGLRLPPSSPLLGDDHHERPTSVLAVPPELRRRQQAPIATCGYIGGDAR